MLSTEPKHIIITHGGGDGVCAAAIATTKLQYPIDLHFSQSYTIKGLIKKLLRTEQHDKTRIYILDIHINASVVELLKPFNKVVYIDHHHNSIKHKGTFPGNIDQYKSTSQLASEYFSALKTPLATLGTICERMLTVSPTDPMLNESQILQKSMICKYDDDDFRRYIVQQMSNGLMPSQIPQISDRNKFTDNTMNRLLKQANNNIIRTKSCAIAVINENGKGFGRQIANKLIHERDHPVFLLYPDTERNKIVILARNSLSQKNKIDLSKFMSMYFDGGGHANAAGGVIDGIDNTGIKIVTESFEEYLDGIKC